MVSEVILVLNSSNVLGKFGSEKHSFSEKLGLVLALLKLLLKS